MGEPTLTPEQLRALRKELYDANVLIAELRQRVEQADERARLAAEEMARVRELATGGQRCAECLALLEDPTEEPTQP